MKPDDEAKLRRMLRTLAANVDRRADDPESDVVTAVRTALQAAMLIAAEMNDLRADDPARRTDTPNAL